MNLDSIQTLLSELENAAQHENWQDVERLDRLVNETLQANLASSNKDLSQAELVAILEHVQKVYAHLQEQSKSFRLQYQTDLKRLNQEKKASNFYQQSSQFK